MAISASGLTSAFNSGNASSYASASITPTANRLILCAVASRRSGATPSAPTLSGNGLTWVQVATTNFDTANFCRLTVFRALGASPSAGAVTISFSGETQQSCAFSIAEFPAIDTGGTNGSAAIVQAVTGASVADADGVHAITLAAFGSAANATYAAFSSTVRGYDASPGSGFTEIHDRRHTLEYPPIFTEFTAANDTVADATLSGTAGDTLGGIAIEIKAAAVTATTGTATITGTGELSAAALAGPDFDLQSVISLPTAFDFSDRLRSFTIHRGRSFNLDRVEAGTCEEEFTNADGALDPANADSPYFGEILPLRETRLMRRENGITYSRFLGRIERYKPHWQPPNYQSVAVEASDAFETLANIQLVSDQATLTTDLTGANNDLVFTAVDAGGQGDDITVEYVVAGTSTALVVETNEPLDGSAQFKGSIVAQDDWAGRLFGSASTQRGTTTAAPTTPFTVSVQGSDILVTVATDGGGAATSTASQVKAALELDPAVMALVSITLAPANSGAGVVTAMTKSSLSGGKWPIETSGERITRCLDLAGWDADLRDIDDGVFSIVESGFSEAQNASVLSHIQDVADSELGYIFVSGDGRIVFHDGGHRSRETRSITSQLTLADDGTGFPYHGIELSFDKDRIANRVTVTSGIEGALPQMVEDVTSQAQPPDGYGLRTLSKQTLLAFDSDALAIAQVLLDAYMEPRTRFEQITVLEDGRTDEWSAAILGREIGDLITVRTSPPGHSTTISYDCFIESIEDSRSVGLPWKVVFEATPMSEAVSGPPGGGGAGALVDSSGDSFTLDSATAGVLG